MQYLPFTHLIIWCGDIVPAAPMHMCGAFQWPSGNNSHTDWRRTGSLYVIEDVKEVYVKDSEWYTESITVQGKRVIIKVNNKTAVDYTEPDNVQRPTDMAGRIISHGTFALQGHDPKSKVLFKDIKVRP